MAILEVGINLGSRTLLNLKYYSDSDNVLDHKLRAKFLNGLESFVSEVYGDEMNVISFSNFQIVCSYEKLDLIQIETKDAEILFIFAITEKETDPIFVRKHLDKILSKFLTMFEAHEILCEDIETFKEFEPTINKVLGDLRFKLDDRISTLF